MSSSASGVCELEDPASTLCNRHVVRRRLGRQDNPDGEALGNVLSDLPAAGLDDSVFCVGAGRHWYVSFIRKLVRASGPSSERFRAVFTLKRSIVFV
jgi:hypothetical protein